MKTILILTNSLSGLYNFRKELIEELILKKFNVVISAPNDKLKDFFRELGCNVVETNVDRRGTNPGNDFVLLMEYLKIMKKFRPRIVLTYTIKPNIYGGLVCQIAKTPHIANITGLGTAIENKGILKNMTLYLYRLGLRKSKTVFFQNEENLEFMRCNHVAGINGKLIPGSGVNIERHKFENYPEEKENLKFLFIGRLMKAKGIEELFASIEVIKTLHPEVEFHFVGAYEENYGDKIKYLNDKKLIIYHGKQDDVHEFLKKAHALVNPSHHEGMSNVLLEAASTGRPVLASNVPGCKEAFDEGVSGFGFSIKNIESLTETLIKFIELPYESKLKMGKQGRIKIENEFDRKIVVDSYMEKIYELVGE